MDSKTLAKQLILFFFIVVKGSCQSPETVKLERTVERVQNVPNLNNKHLIGYHGENVIFESVDDQFNNQYSYYKLDETQGILDKHPIKFFVPLAKSNWESGFLHTIGYYNGFWLYTIGYSNSDYTTYYQNIWTQRDGDNVFLDSVYNSDKKISVTFPTKSNEAIITTLNTLGDYYNANQDNRIRIFDLQEKSTQSIPCQGCADVYRIAGTTFFTKVNSRDDFSDGFSWTDIYYATAADLNDSIKIASFSDIRALTPDGKYLLIERIFDLPNRPLAILEVETRKYQLLLGRDYSAAEAFYSYFADKFAFKFGDRIVYLEFPKKYPFDAHRRGNSDIPNWVDRKFYKQFDHTPFAEK